MAYASYHCLHMLYLACYVQIDFFLSFNFHISFSPFLLSYLENIVKGYGWRKYGDLFAWHLYIMCAVHLFSIQDIRIFWKTAYVDVAIEALYPPQTS